LQALSEDRGRGVCPDRDARPVVRPTRDPGELDAVHRLTHDAFLERGYCRPQPDGRLRHHPALDLARETTVFVAVADGVVVGTNSLTLDGPGGLPMDRDFRVECHRVRAEGRVLAASWRLATHRTYRDQSFLVKELIRVTTVFGVRSSVETCLFTFNPRHERVYQRLLNLRTIGRRKGMAGLLNAPAVLMRSDLERLPERWLA
jgi:hypothetical protein